MQVQGIGAFVRVLLPVHLSGGYALTVGTWLAVDPSELRSIWKQWDTPTYASLTLTGYVANAIPPWGEGTLHAPATARVRESEFLPCLDSSTTAVLQGVMSREWEHEPVLSAWELT